MSKKASIPGTVEAWETGQLGTDEAHVRKSGAGTKDAIDEALGLQSISIRLPKTTIEAYKNLAEIHGVGYQPLMRDAICRWAESEMKLLLIGAVESQRLRRKTRAPKDKVHAPPSSEPPMKRAA